MLRAETCGSLYSDAAKLRAMFEALEKKTQPKSPAAPGHAYSGISGKRNKSASGIQSLKRERERERERERDTHTHTHTI